MWTDSGALAEQREQAFLQVLESQIARLADAAQTDLKPAPVIVSGMAASSIGLREIPHKLMPFAIDGSDLRVEVVDSSDRVICLVSGVRTDGDFMRGEEVQLVGAVELGADREALHILPGTHSKHVTIERGSVVGFRTYMTGEFFELLSRRSILANSVDAAGQSDPADGERAFNEGAKRGVETNLLHASFGVRVAQLLGRRNRSESYHYLSGLLIGSELGEVAGARSVALTGSPGLTARYHLALRTLGFEGGIQEISGEEAVASGHRLLARRLGLCG